MTDEQLISINSSREDNEANVEDPHPLLNLQPGPHIDGQMEPKLPNNNSNPSNGNSNPSNGTVVNQRRPNRPFLRYYSQISSTGDIESSNGEELQSIHSMTFTSPHGDLIPREDTPYTPHQVDKMRRSLKYYFMTPCGKYRAKRRKPWKLLLQLIKIVVVTLQVIALAAQRAEFVDFQRKTKLALKHIMCKDWDAGYETPPYPAAIGDYALYKNEDVFEHLNYAMTYYNKTPMIAIGAYGYSEEQFNMTSRTARLEIRSFKQSKISPHNATFIINPTIVKETITFGATKGPNGTLVYDIKQTLKLENTTIEINSLHEMVLHFNLTGVHIKEKATIEPFNTPDCLEIHGQIIYDNTNHDGQMLIKVVVGLTSISCHDESIYARNQTTDIAVTMLFDITVIVLCFLSTCTCARSMYRSQTLLKRVRKFFRCHFGYDLKLDDIMDFISLWYVMIMVSDILCIAGTGLKIAITYKKLMFYDSASMTLGVANILVWFGVLRYLEYYSKFNVLMLTLKKAFPDVIRFMICALVFLFAFVFCGWLVLGPYHVKFTSVASTLECLFSLMNGDDMFITFSMIDDKAPSEIWVFSRIYLYSFISLFIYFILNVFISVIIGSYEAIKLHNDDSLIQKTAVERFMESYDDQVDSPLYQSDLLEKSCGAFCCNIKADEGDDTENIIAS